MRASPSSFFFFRKRKRTSAGMSCRRSRSGRQVQRKHIEAIVQVPAELSLAHPLGQIAVRGRKNADVEMNAVAAAEAFHVLVFQHAQQLGLRSRRKFAYFVEKERAAACAFKAPPSAGDLRP